MWRTFSASFRGGYMTREEEGVYRLQGFNKIKISLVLFSSTPFGSDTSQCFSHSNC